jgi:hypothetical protein
MIIENPNNYTHIGFEKSSTKNKKYDAILKNKETGRTKKVPFGDSRYQQFYDSTGLNLYTHLNHGDKARRRLYYDRHGMTAPLYSSKWFSHKFLW